MNLDKKIDFAVIFSVKNANPKVIWWEHGSKSGRYSSARVHGSLHVAADGTFTLDNLDGLKPEIIEGF